MTSRKNLSLIREQVREFFLLEDAERQLSSLTNSQRANIRAYYDAAERRLAVARDLRGPSETPSAVTLYRERGLFLALALIAGKDADCDLGSLTPESVLLKLEGALANNGVKPVPELEKIRSVLLSSDPLELERLTANEAAQRAEELDTTTHWLQTLVDPCLPRDLKLSRVTRLTTVIAGAVAILAALVAWVAAPSNLAKDKSATSSSAAYKTAPAAAVDGSKVGNYGFHSADEESPWLAIDLGKTYVVTKVKVFGRGDPINDQSVPLALEASDDGDIYRQIETRSRPFSASDPWIVEPPSVAVRFIRLRTLRRSYLVLNEVEVYGRSVK